MLEITNIFDHDPRNYMNEREKVMVNVQTNVNESPSNNMTYKDKCLSLISPPMTKSTQQPLSENISSF